MPISTYKCPISLDAPRVPVLTNESITYDFVSIAHHLLRENTDNHPDVNPMIDPLTRGAITFLTYNRSTKILNDDIMTEVLPLSDDEKNEIAQLYTRLTNRYPQLKIHGMHTLEGVQELIDALAANIALQLQLNPDYMDEDGQTSLFLAAQAGSVDIVRQLLTHDLNPNQPWRTLTPLYIAAQQGHLPVVNALLADERVLPNQADNHGLTPLFVAAYKGHLPVVNALLSNNGARDYFFTQLIEKPSLLRESLAQNNVLMTALAHHRDALWVRLQTPALCNLKPAAHHVLLQAILRSSSGRDNALCHPLYMLFNAPQNAHVLFTSSTSNILDDMQKYMDDTYLEAKQSGIKRAYDAI